MLAPARGVAGRREASPVADADFLSMGVEGLPRRGCLRVRGATAQRLQNSISYTAPTSFINGCVCHSYLRGRLVLIFFLFFRVPWVGPQKKLLKVIICTTYQCYVYRGCSIFIIYTPYQCYVYGGTGCLLGYRGIGCLWVIEVTVAAG